MSKKVKAKERITPNFIELVKAKKGVNINGKILPPLVFEYLKHHPKEKMYINKKYNNIEAILSKAIKWDKELNKTK